jgi:hypothetical protein
MAGLDPAIQSASNCEIKSLDGRLKSGHDEKRIRNPFA